MSLLDLWSQALALELVQNRKSMKKIISLILLVAAVTLVGCDAWEDVNQFDNGDRSKTLMELLEDKPDLSTFVQVLSITGYADKLGSDMNYTVFAPSNSALGSMDMTDTLALTAWVENHVSEKIAYTDQQGAFAIDSILMLNKKQVPIIDNLVAGVPVSDWNITSRNGVLHILNGYIEERLNLWEYVQTLSANPVVSFINSFNTRVMDMDRSVQRGVNSDGKPVYDTIWAYRNPLLEATPLADESVASTFLLLDQSGLDALKAKYAKYFNQKDSLRMEIDILKEIVNDLVLPYTLITADGRYPNQHGVLVDVNTAAITGQYTASNGHVYLVSSVEVKMYQNKIKPLTIEAEDFVSCWPDAWQKRPRTWASGGYDMVLKSRTRHSYDWTVITPIDTLVAFNGGDSIVYDTTVTNINNLWDLTYRNNEWPGVNTLGEPNAYISYQPRLYSTGYEIYWKAYDDNAWKSHVDSRGVAMEFYQKLYISFPGEKVLQRTSANVITGQFSSTSVPGFTANHSIMAAKMRAGENVETQLVRYKVNQGHTVYGSSYVLYSDATVTTPVPTTSEDIYGKEGLLKCPYYGQATFFVSNTCVGEFIHSDGTTQAYLQSSKSNNAPGMIFLDYIRLEPQVDPND